jgi:hypothetical protein
MDGKSVADMSRAKQMKSLFRMITPHLNLKDIPLVAVNHTYKEIGLYPKDIVSGGTGAYYSADAIWIIGRQQEKAGTEIMGYHLIINIEKSRHIREKSKIPVTVTFEGGISKWSGLMEVAEQGGYTTKPNLGWYEGVNPKTGEILTTNKIRAKEVLESSEFWLMMFEKTDLASSIKSCYTMASGQMFTDQSNLNVQENDLDD